MRSYPGRARNRYRIHPVVDELLETWPDGLGHAQRFIGLGPEHRQQRCHDQHQQQHERRECGQRFAPTQPGEYPLVYGIAQGRKDRREQDREQEGADHREERGGYRGDQQQEKGLPEAGLSHQKRPAPVRGECEP